jgi:NAD(P) transhydrogenase subunit beta
VSELLINGSYLVAAVMFIVGLRMLSSPKTAVNGNLIAAIGMLVAVLATLISSEVVSYGWIILGAAVGGGVGAFVALRIAMTSMPQMVALLNGLGGAASAMVASADLVASVSDKGIIPTGIVPPAVALSVLIGGVTLTGSLVAYAKLQELISGSALTYPGQQIVNGLIGAGCVVLCVIVSLDASQLTMLWALFGLALVIGVLLVIPIGGADMPVVISLLNSYSGIAACATGFVLDNSALVISGALVGAAGIILTKIMCDAMNRSLANVLFGAFGAVQENTGGGGGGGDQPQGNVKGYTPQDAAVIFSNARSVIIVPGYGMAVAQAQHAVRDLADTLAEKGINVNYAIHPVAGRMPGHMNVLLAEADVPYESLVEMDEINPQFSETDVALVLGANDVVNPSARTEKGSPIYGMPILDVDKATHVFVVKRSMNPGFAGIQNPLFFNENTMMIFGDAKKTVIALAEAVRSY